MAIIIPPVAAFAAIHAATCAHNAAVKTALAPEAIPKPVAMIGSTRPIPATAIASVPSPNARATIVLVKTGFSLANSATLEIITPIFSKAPDRAGTTPSASANCTP